MDYNAIIVEIERLFENLGFSPIIINGTNFMKFKECYCKMTYLKDWSAFVIESADNIHDAEKWMLDDGNLYYTDVS